MEITSIRLIEDLKNVVRRCEIEGILYISLFDIVKLVTGAKNPHEKTAQTFQMHPNVITIDHYFKFNGAGQRETSVVTYEQAIKFVMLLTGKRTKVYREAVVQSLLELGQFDDDFKQEIEAQLDQQRELIVSDPAKLIVDNDEKQLAVTSRAYKEKYIYVRICYPDAYVKETKNPKALNKNVIKFGIAYSLEQRHDAYNDAGPDNGYFAFSFQYMTHAEAARIESNLTLAFSNITVYDAKEYVDCQGLATELDYENYDPNDYSSYRGLAQHLFNYILRLTKFLLRKYRNKSGLMYEVVEEIKQESSQTTLNTDGTLIKPKVYSELTFQPSDYDHANHDPLWKAQARDNKQNEERMRLNKQITTLTKQNRDLTQAFKMSKDEVRALSVSLRRMKKQQRNIEVLYDSVLKTLEDHGIKHVAEGMATGSAKYFAHLHKDDYNQDDNNDEGQKRPDAMDQDTPADNERKNILNDKQDDHQNDEYEESQYEEKDAHEQLPPPVKLRSKGKVIGRDLRTGEEIVFNSMEKAARHLDMSPHALRDNFLDQPRQYGGRHWRRENKPHWIPPPGFTVNLQVKEKATPCFVKAVNTQTQEERIYESVVTAAQICDINRRKLNDLVLKNKEYEGIQWSKLPVEECGSWSTDATQLQEALFVVDAESTREQEFEKYKIIERCLTTGSEKVYTNIRTLNAAVFKSSPQAVMQNYVDKPRHYLGKVYRLYHTKQYWCPPPYFRFRTDVVEECGRFIIGKDDEGFNCSYFS